MKVKELIKKLKNFNQDARVFLASDAEGNSYSPLANAYGFFAGSFDDDKKDKLSKYDTWCIDDKEKTGEYLILFPY